MLGRSDLVKQQQSSVLTQRGIQLVLWLRPVVLAAVEVEQTDSRADLTQVHCQQAGGGEGGPRNQRNRALFLVLWTNTCTMTSDIAGPKLISTDRCGQTEAAITLFVSERLLVHRCWTQSV